MPRISLSPNSEAQVATVASLLDLSRLPLSGGRARSSHVTLKQPKSWALQSRRGLLLPLLSESVVQVQPRKGLPHTDVPRTADSYLQHSQEMNSAASACLLLLLQNARGWVVYTARSSGDLEALQWLWKGGHIVTQLEDGVTAGACVRSRPGRGQSLITIHSQ